MRSFIILGFLVAVASAAVLPGYQYGPGVSGIRRETIVANSGLSGSYTGHQGSSYNNAVGGQINSASGIINSSSGSGLINSGVYGGSASGAVHSGHYKQTGSSGQIFNIGYDALDSVPQTVHYSKQFYHFDAPEEAQVEGQITRQLSNVLKKNLQVVFIKAPENNAATNAALQLAKQAIEQRTAIYVLTKQNDAAQLVGKLQQIQENVQTTPEVRFVKYRTPEDVQRAKASIQSQYDSFGGISESYNGGVAPVLNYASAGKPSQFIFEGSNKGSSSSGSTYTFGTKTELPQLVGSGSINKQSSSIVSSGQSFGTGSNSKFGSSIAGSAQSFGAGINKQSGFGSGSISKQGSSIVSSGQSFGSNSKFGSGTVGSSQSFGAGINKQSGFGISASAQPIESGSNIKFGASTVGSSQSFGISASAQPIESGSNSKFGSTIVSSAQSFGSGSNNQSGSAITSSSQSTESESNIISESESTQLNEVIDGSSDSSSNTETTSNISNLSYLPPTPLKK